MAITFDPIGKVIALDTFDVSAEEIWSRYIDWAALSDNLKYVPGVSQLGGVAPVALYIYLEDGWLIRPIEADGISEITGNLLVQGGGNPMTTTVGNWNAVVVLKAPFAAQSLGTTGGTGDAPTVQQIRIEMDTNSTKLTDIKTNLATHDVNLGVVNGKVDSLNNISSVEVKTEVDAALAEYDGPTRLEATADKNALIAHGDLNWSGAGSAPTVQQIRAEIDLNSTKLSSLLSNLATHDVNLGVTNGNVNDIESLVTALNNLSKAEVDASLVSYDGPTRLEATADKNALIAHGDLNWADVGGSAPTVQQIRAEIDLNSTKLIALLTNLATHDVNLGVTNGNVNDIESLVTALNNISSVEVKTEVDAALVEYDGPTRLEATADKNELIAHGDLNWFTGIDGAPPTVQQIRAEIDLNSTKLNTIRSDIATHDVNLGVVNGNVNDIETLVNGLNNISDVEVKTEVDAALAEYDGPTRLEATADKQAIIDRGNIAWFTGVDGAPPTVQQIRTEMDTNSTQLTGIRSDIATHDANLGVVNVKVGNIEVVVLASQIDIKVLKDHANGDWEIVNDQIIYRTESGAILRKFNLTKEGIPNSLSPDKRVYVP